MNDRLLQFPGHQPDSVLTGIYTPPISGNVGNKLAICMHGFERAATTEPKFSALIDGFSNTGIGTVRFDFTGSGLSRRGDFSTNTVQGFVEDLENCLNALTQAGLVGSSTDLILVAHSLGACVAAKFLDSDTMFKENVKKIILLAPALNQRELMRYWFAVTLEKNNPTKGISVGRYNYKDLAQEQLFQKDCARSQREAKSHYIGDNYYKENQDMDYTSLLVGYKDRILLVHGDRDSAVPLESLDSGWVSSLGQNVVVVKGGDHDMERPTMQDQRVDTVVKFVK